jgi:hypothetical protein
MRIRESRRKFIERSSRLRDEAQLIVYLLQWSEARYRRRIGEVPLVLGNANEVAYRRIAHPSTPKRGLGQFGRHSRLQENADIRAGGDRINRGQTCRIECWRGRRPRFSGLIYIGGGCRGSAERRGAFA